VRGQTPFVYLGAAHTTFAWHREDANLASVNHHLWGAPKVWFTVRPEDTPAAVRCMRERWPLWDPKCLDPAQHKLWWVDPRLLRLAGVDVRTIVQQPGDLVVTPPGGLHAGFNVATNMATAVNTIGWLAESWRLAWSAAVKSLLATCAGCRSHVFLDVSLLKRRIWVEHPELRRLLPGDDVVPPPPGHIDCHTDAYKAGHPDEARAAEEAAAAYQARIRREHPQIPRFYWSPAERAAMPADSTPPDLSPLQHRGYWHIGRTLGPLWSVGTVGAPPLPCRAEWCSCGQATCTRWRWRPRRAASRPPC